MDEHVKLFQIQDNIVTSISQLYQRPEESIAEDVQNLKDWMKFQLHLPEILDDKSIQNFLFLNKCSVERTKDKIDMYYSIRSHMSDVYKRCNPSYSNMKEVTRHVYNVPLPKMTEDNCRIIVNSYRMKELVDQIDPYDVLRLISNLQEIRLKEDVMFKDIFIFDTEGASIGYLSKLTPVFLHKALTFYKGVYSIPVKEIYIINTVPYINTILRICKGILKPKIFERIHVCKDASILKDRFPLDVLPKDYGGEGISLEEINDLCKIKFEEYQDRFDVLDKLRVDENLRPQKLENDDVLGYYGHFKKLNID